jgi:hypothetical protein
MQIELTIFPSVIPNMHELPSNVKQEFNIRFSAMKEGDENNCIRYRNQMCIVYPDNTVYGWAPSVSDSFASDWCILD